MSRKFINKWINDGEGMIKYCQEYSLGKDVLDIHKGECKSRRINQRYHAGEQIPNCQCDLMCITFQDCCDDAILGPQLDSLGIGFNTSFALELFEAVQCISNEYSHKDKRHNLGFYMVADCPSKSSFSSLRRHCRVEIDPKNQLVSHYIPVNINWMVYRNIFCALCFGENVSIAHHWPLDVGRVEKHKFQDCLKLKEILQRNVQVRLSVLKTVCSSVGFAVPSTRFWDGPDRLGKLCLAPGGSTESGGLQRPLSWPEASLSLPKADLVCLETIEAMVQNRRTRDEMETQRILFLKTADGFSILPSQKENMIELCQKCDENFLSLIAIHPESLKSFFGYGNIGTDGKITIFFESVDVSNCESLGNCAQTSSSLIPSIIHVIVSQTGAGTSVLILCIYLYAMMFRQDQPKSSSKRFQICFVLSKILFFLTFFLSYWLRQWEMACKIVSAFLHGSLLLSLFYSFLFGMRISIMMWRLKNQLASLSYANKDDKLTWRELVGTIVAFLVCMLGCGALVAYESISGTAYFGFGINQVCVATTEKGSLILVIVPIIVTLVINVINTVYSGFILYQLMESNVASKGGTTKRFITFLGRMISFQSLQWSLGLIFSVTQNEVVGFIFQVFLSFEGVIISGSFFWDEVKCK